MAERLRALDGYLVGAAVVLTCVLFTSRAADPVNPIKLTALVLCGLAVVASAAARVVLERQVRVPSGPAAGAAVALLLALLVSAAVAPVTTTAVVGAYGRNSGLLAYLAALALFMSALRVLRPPRMVVPLAGIVIAAGFTSSYGALQRLGLDAIAWDNPFNPIIAALGNPNFASGYLGIGGSVAVGGAIWGGWTRAWRVVSGVTGALCLVVAAASNSVQGPIAAAAGLAVVAAAWALEQPQPRRRVALGALGAAAGAGGVLLGVAAVAQRGPLAAAFTDSGGMARRTYWEAALNMVADKPLLGVGLDHYGQFWWSQRPLESVARLGGADYSDAAHSVPLQMAAQGGLLLGLAYAGFVVTVGVFLVAGLLRLRGHDRGLLGAFGGGWLAYQVQSAVSIDQVPLITLHFVLAAAVIAAAGGAPLRHVRLPGAAGSQPAGSGRARRAAMVLPRQASSLDAALLGVIALATLIAAWQALTPFRANAAVASGDAALRAGQGNAALDAYMRATELVPGQSQYWTRQATLLTQVEQASRASFAYRRAAAADPYDVTALRNAVVALENNDQVAEARRLSQRLVEVDPMGPDSVVLVASFELRHGGAARARVLLEDLVRYLPSNTSALAKLGDARAVLGDVAGAQDAYRRALELDPAQNSALEGLEKLKAASGGR